LTLQKITGKVVTTLALQFHGIRTVGPKIRPRFRWNCLSSCHFN